VAGPGGTTDHPMDPRGRVTFPAKYHRELHDDLVLVKSVEKNYPSLSIYPRDEYDQWVDRYFESLGGFNELSAKHVRMWTRLYKDCTDVTVDQAGRILIPANLREYAQLEKNVSIVGVRKFVQLWNPDILESYMADHEDEDDLLTLP
jgi:MraZ protein